MIGKSLSRFDITAKLGEGGMGEVYRAHDSRLDREVAVKVLPAEFTADAERLARFEREARVLASFDHPNIAGIHEVGEAEVAGSTVHYLVMQLVEGEDLTARLEGPLPVEEAARLALQIAEALEAAHERGIVHRDLKPANVKITPGGQIKVLDFGLAKSWGDPARDPDLTVSPTLTGRMTQAGMILGTAGYMSPEQARGEEADRRSDIWSFGVLLYEMLAGDRLFESKTVSDTLARVLLAEIDLGALEPRPPRAIRGLLARCLEREPRRRLQAIGEARIVLERYLAAPAAEDEPGNEGAAAVPQPQRSGDLGAAGRGSWLPWTVAALALALAVFGWLRPGSPRSAREGGVGRYWLTEIVRPRPNDAIPRSFVLSPDGERVVFDAGTQVLVRDRSELEPRILVEGVRPQETGSSPFWSPDGKWVGYYDDSRLWRIAADGGARQRIASVPETYRGSAWGADDRIVYSLARGDVYSISAFGGEATRLLHRVEGEDVDFHAPTFLPDGRTLLYAVHRPAAVDTLEVYDGKERRVVYRLEGQRPLQAQVLNDPVYSSTGHVVYRRDAGERGVWAVPFSVDELRVTGEPFLVAANGVWPSVSADGRSLVYGETRPRPSRLLRLDRGDLTATPIGAQFWEMGDPALSADGRKIAVAAREGSSHDLFLVRLDGRSERLTRTPDDDEEQPSWSPDGAALFFDRYTAAGPAIYRMPADGSGPPEQVVAAAQQPRVSPRGGRILYATSGRGAHTLASLDLITGEESLLLTTERGLPNARLSPDERVLAYRTRENGPGELCLRLFPDGPTCKTIPSSDPVDMAWSADGGRLFYLDIGTQVIRSVWVRTVPGLEVGPPELEVDLARLGRPTPRFTSLELFPDGGSFLLVESVAPDENPGRVVLVENWIEAFR